MPPTRVVLGLAAIVVAAAGLRFYGLDVQSLWNDELSGWSRSGAPTWLEVATRATPPDHPPGYFVFLHFWTRFVGDSEALLRLPSAIAGTLAVAGIFFLGRKLYSDTEGLIAAGLTAVLWFPVHYSQEARANVFILLFSILSTYWLIDVVRALRRGDAPPIGAVVVFGVVATLCCYVHYFGLLFILLQAVFAGLALGRDRGALVRLAAIYAVVLLAYFPWLWRASLALSSGSPAWLQPPRPSDLWDLLRFLFNRSSQLAWMVSALWATLVVRKAALLWTGRTPVRAVFSSPTFLLIVWLVVPVAFVYVRSVLVAPAFIGRNFAIVAPAAYLLTARAMTQLPLRRYELWTASLALSALLLWHLVWWTEYYVRPTKDQFRQAVAFLVGHDDPKEVVVIAAAAWRGDYFDYYFERFGSSRRVDLIAVEAGDVERVMGLVADRSADVVWFLAGHRRPSPELLDSMKRRLRLSSERGFVGAHAWRFVPRHDSRAAP